jgi:DNA-binding transcriptional LysR family regulator
VLTISSARPCVMIALPLLAAAFVVDARAALDALDQGVINARRVANGQIGSVRIALTSSVAFHPLATASIRQFRATHPDIAIDLDEINAADIIERMMSGRIDAGILRKPIETPSALRFDLLHEERMVPVLPVGHALLEHPKSPRARKSHEHAHRQSHVPLEALAGEPFIFVRRPGAPGRCADFIRACEAVGFKPEVVSEVPRMSSAINLVAAGGRGSRWFRHPCSDTSRKASCIARSPATRRFPRRCISSPIATRRTLQP